MKPDIHPQYIETVRTYVQNLGIEVVEVPWSSDGSSDGRVGKALDYGFRIG